MTTPLHLDALLTALRAAGLRVGISEVLRLRQVFTGQPGLSGEGGSRDRLRSLLRAVLVKSAEDRGTFDRVCDAWLDRAEEEIALRRFSRRQPVPVPGPVRKKSRWRSVLRQGAMAAVLAGLLLMVDRDMRVGPIPPSPPNPVSQLPSQPPGVGAPPPIVTPDDLRKRSFLAQVPTLEVTARPWHFLLRPEMGLAALAWLGAGGLWLVLRRRRLLPEPEPLPPAEGPPRAFPLPVVPAGAVLLAPREQEGLAWGVGRFVSEEPTRRLDLTATVRATARAGGFPEMRFHRARFYREVWLWVDEDAADPALPRLAAEIETVLAAQGLPIERAAFRGIPDRLVRASGQVFAPNEIDERRDAALVAILTDGRRLVRRWASDDQRVRIDALLRSLSHWPHLAFVDASRDPEGLAAIVGRHGLPVIPPESAAAFLGGAALRKAPPAGEDQGGEVAWAAACALCPSSVDEVTALDLRHRLGLAVSPYALQALRAEAPGPPGRLAWRTADRIRRVSWLREAEAQPNEAVAPHSLLGRALDFWEAVYDQSLEMAAGRAAERILRIERALLGLWRSPGEHIAALYQLYQGPLKEEIRRHLTVLAPAGWGGAGVIQLPWPWSRPEPVERAMLREMGFGGGMPAVGLRRPGRIWLGIGLLSGLGVAAGVAAWHAHLGQKPEVVAADTLPAGVGTEWKQMEDGAWRITVAAAQMAAAAEAEGGSRVLVRWQPQQVRCVEREPGGYETWRCGRAAVRGPRPPGVTRSVVYLDRTLGSAAVEELALDLLDSGSADLVVLGGTQVRGLPSPALESQQTLVITRPARPYLGFAMHIPWLQGDQLGDAAKLLRFEGVRPAREILPGFRAVSGDPERVLLRGLSTGCRNTQVEVDGFTFVRICPGTFTMGSQQGETGAFDNEMPAHKVTLGEFWMSQFEVTNEQYRQLYPDHKGEPDLPVTEVSWTEARAYCDKLGHRLPTEAEWEYAARAGTVTPWSSGSDEQDLERVAWFDRNSGGDPRPVGRRDPNPWGLHDMHGNVWEWVEDWFGTYPAGGQVNPQGPRDGAGRVERGGSFAVPAGFLRSAVRVWDGPGFRNGGIGFRCVRGPRRQP